MPLILTAVALAFHLSVIHEPRETIVVVRDDDLSTTLDRGPRLRILLEQRLHHNAFLSAPLIEAQKLFPPLYANRIKSA